MTLALDLTKFMRDKKRSLGKLAELTQELDARAEKQNVELKLRGVAKRTLANWRNGIVKHPRLWEELVLVAAALELDAAQTDELLHAARHQSLAELRAREPRADRLALLARWEADAPFQVGPDLNYFAGRKMEAAKLQDALLKQRAVTICGLRGMGGVGKTTLARHLAYRLRNQFPDGVLWGQLNRSDTMSILASFAREYKLDVSEFHDVESRSRAVQSLLANRRVLIILDNAQTSEQVRPLLPPSTGKPAVMITTRHDLAVSDEMLAFELRPFASDGQEALELCTNILGEQTARRQRGALLELAALLGYLPLALAIAANRLRQTPVGAKRERAVNEFLERVRGEIAHVEFARLDELTRENLSVRVTFDQSFAELTDAQKNFFIALGAFAGNDFNADAAAHVAQVSLAQAEAFLNELVGLSLVEIARAGRYTLHRLLRDYAREKMVGTEAYARTIEYFTELVRRLGKDNHKALGLEESNLVASLERAVQLGLFEALVNNVEWWMDFVAGRGLGRFAESLWQTVLAQLPSGSKEIMMIANLYLGRAFYLQMNLAAGRHQYEIALNLAYELESSRTIVDALMGLILTTPKASLEIREQNHRKALAISREIGYDAATAKLLNNLANIYVHLDLERAVNTFRESLELALRNGDSGLVMRALANLSEVESWHGQWSRSHKWLQQLEGLIEQLAAPWASSLFLNTAGEIALREGDVTRAESYFSNNVSMLRVSGGGADLARALAALGEIAWRNNNRHQARIYFQDALKAAEKGIGFDEMSEINSRMGEYYLFENQTERASEEFRRAIANSQVSEDKLGEAGALFGLARACHVQGESKYARDLAGQSASILEKVGHYRAAQVRAWLEQLPA